ncbi:MAG: hypothetical protein ACYTEG_02120 [Planctomycetota bacterium]
MSLATRTDVLTLELISCCPSTFSYADKQLLKSGEPDAIQRLVDRKHKRLRWWLTGVILFAALMAIQGVALTIVSDRRWQELISSAFWIVILAAYARKLVVDSAALRDSGARLIEHLNASRGVIDRAS